MSNQTFPQIIRLLTRIQIKAWALFCALVTRFFHPLDFMTTNLLLCYRTDLQMKWENHLIIQTASINLTTKKLLVVIPFRDNWNYTYKCLLSLNKQDHNGLGVTVVLVDNGSIEDKTRQGIEELKSRTDLKSQISYVRYDIPFNFSILNNMAVNDHSDVNADYLLLLNNDVEFLEPNSLLQMVSFISNNPECGALGCTLLYPDRKIQHLFISVGAKIVGAHPFRGKVYNPSEEWYSKPRVAGAATGAALLTSVQDYKSVDGLDENLGSASQDVDYCLKVQDMGKYVAVLPQVNLIHHETVSRASIHEWQEISYMYEKWGSKLTKNNYFSPRFTRWSEQLALSLGEGNFPWQKLVIPKNPKQAHMILIASLKKNAKSKKRLI